MKGTAAPTLPDLVVLSLLAEGPRHGYGVNQELERREVRDWAGISRPQVYYSLKKLASAKLIRPVGSATEAIGPERQEFRITAAGRRELARALERADWAEHRPPPPFLTWLALSWSIGAPERLRVISRRREFLEAEAARERRSLAEVTREGAVEAALMIELVIGQFEAELRWLDRVEQRIATPRGYTGTSQSA